MQYLRRWVGDDGRWNLLFAFLFKKKKCAADHFAGSITLPPTGSQTNPGREWLFLVYHHANVTLPGMDQCIWTPRYIEMLWKQN